MNWRTETRKLSELIPFDGNPRKLTKIQQKDIEKSIDNFGYVEIIAINQNNKILAGNQRYNILFEKHGKDHEVEVRVPSRELTVDEEREYNIRSNKNTADWDFDLLKDFADPLELMEWGFDDVSFFIEDETNDENDDEHEESLEVKHKMQYVVLIFNSKEDFEEAKKKLKLKTVATKVRKEGHKRSSGLQRILDGKQLISRLND